MRNSDQRGRTLYAGAVDAATTIIAQSGRVPDLAELATILSVTETTLAQIFTEDDSLTNAIAENAMLLLYDRFVRSVVKADANDPIAQFHALADAYIEWAYDHPREFRIIGSMPGADFQNNDLLMRHEKSIHALMLRLLTSAQNNGRLAKDENLPMLIAIAHTYAYGVASKMLLGDLTRWAPGLDELELARHALRIFIQKFLGQPQG